MKRMLREHSSDSPDTDAGADGADDRLAWLTFLDSAGTLADLLQDIGHLCSAEEQQSPLAEICVPLDFPVLANRQPQLAERLVHDCAGCLSDVGRALSSAALDLGMACGPNHGVLRLMTEARIFQFPSMHGIARVGQLASGLGRLCSLECQIVSVVGPLQCVKALRYQCQDEHCASVLCNRPIIAHRSPGDGLAIDMGLGSRVLTRCPECHGPIAEDPSGRLQTDCVRALAMPTAAGAAPWPISCVAIGNRVTRQLTLGCRYRLVGIPVRIGNCRSWSCDFEIVDCEPLLPSPSYELAFVAVGLELPSNLARGGGRYAVALYAAYHLGSDCSPAGSWMTVKLALLLLMLAAAPNDGGDAGADFGDDAIERLKPISLCLMSPGDCNSVRCWLQSAVNRLGGSGVTHRSGVPVAAAVRQLPAGGGQAIDAGTLALAGPGGLAFFPYLGGVAMRTRDLTGLTWCMESGRIAAQSQQQQQPPQPLTCSIVGLIERAASGSRLSPDAAGCYGNDGDDDDVDDAAAGGSVAESEVSMLGCKSSLRPMRRELRALLSRFQLYLECEEPDHAAFAGSRLAAAVSEVPDAAGGESLRQRAVFDLILTHRRRPWEFTEAASAALRRHFMAGRRVFEAKRLSYCREALATVTGLAVGHARLNCRSQVLTGDVLLAAYLVEVSAYCLHGSSHFAVSYLGHIDRLDPVVAVEFEANLVDFGSAVEAFMRASDAAAAAAAPGDGPEE